MDSTRLRIHPAFLVLLALLFFLGRGGDIVIWLLVLFSHELAHLVVARMVGATIDSVELLPFGGRIGMPNMTGADPFAELAVAVAGPLNNLALAGLAFVAMHVVALDAQRIRFFIDSNLAIGLLNLLPALPLDGGRIYRALASPKMGQNVATEQTIEIARLLALAFAILTLVLVLTGLGGLQTAVIAVFLWIMAAQEQRGRALEWTRGFERREQVLRADGILSEHGLVVMEDVRLKQVLRRLFPLRYHRIVVLGNDLTRIGSLSETDIVKALFERGLMVTMGELVRSRA